MAKKPDYFENFPFPPTEKKAMKMTKEQMKLFIYTPENLYASDLNWLIASTNQLTVGIFQVPPGASFDPADVHAGDEVYYILKGNLHELNPKTGQVTVTKQGEALFIPRGVYHKAYNFGSDVLTILYVIAPKIWGPEGPPAQFPGQIKLLSQMNKED